MSKILNTSGEFYSAVFGEKSTGTYIATKNDGTKYERKAQNNHALASIRNIFIKGDP